VSRRDETPLTVGSLFAGIGGFDLGLERAGMRTRWFCEQDEFCQAVLAKHWPGVPCYPDVTRLRGPDIGAVDVLCGGFPCQDLSYAGAGAGLTGARSGLWSEYARLIGELRPRYVIVENVAALLARGLGTVLSDLAALGYDAEWDCIPASAVGAPHRRDRLWIVAYPARDLPAGATSTGAERERTRTGGQSNGAWAPGDTHSDAHNAGRCLVAEHDGGSDELGGRTSGRHTDGLRDEVADAAGVGYERPWASRNGWSGSTNGSRGIGGEPSCARPPNWWAVEPDVGRVAHGVPARVDRLRALGNALVPQIAEWIGRRILEYEAERD
jgi:DNA (cytosine-5)-methyltransferase 1